MTALKIWLSGLSLKFISDPVTHAPGHSKLWVALAPRCLSQDRGGEENFGQRRVGLRPVRSVGFG